MSKILSLINELCPTGVVFKTLGSFCSIKTGRGITSKETTKDGPYPVISGGVEPMGFYHEFNRDENTITIARAGSAGYVNFIKTKFYLNDKCFSIIPNRDADSKYLFYYLKNIENQIIALKSTGSVPTVNTSKIASIKVPVPPIAVQKEIVYILDCFTDLIDGLNKELILRKTQYQFYLDYLFEHCSGVEYMLADLGTFTRGKRFVHADAVDEGGIPCIHYGELYTHYGVFASEAKSQIRKSILEEKKLRYAQKGDVIIVGAGENNEDIGVGVSWEGEYSVAVHDACYTFVTSQNPRFISFYLRSSSYHKQIKSYVAEGKICAISSDGIGKAKLKVPSLKEQQQIVTMLESFYHLISDTINGIPAEICARQKQYEYYRDKLLTFKELEA